MALFFNDRDSPSPEQAGNEKHINFSSDRHFLAQVLGDRDETSNVEPPGRPNAPAPTPTPPITAPPRPVSPVASTFNLGPERPLKLFKLQDFDFLKVLGAFSSLSVL
jgi:hypothetical protein